MYAEITHLLPSHKLLCCSDQSELHSLVSTIRSSKQVIRINFHSKYFILKILFILLLLLLIFITFMQSVYNYISETAHVCSIYILEHFLYLQLMQVRINDSQVKTQLVLLIFNFI